MARSSSNTPKKPRRKSTNAASAYLGFSLQATRLLARLLEAQAGDTVCLEVFEDVGVEKKDGRRIAEQNKSNLATNPLSDRALPFWKTLRNWVGACQDGTLDVDTTYFEIYTSNVASGAIVKAFDGASDIGAAATALAIARKTLLETSDGNSPSDVAQTLAPHLAIVFGRNEETLVAKIIAHFRYRTGSGDPHTDLKPLLTAKLVSEDAYNDVVRWAHGWVKQRIDTLINDGKPASIAYGDFHLALLGFVQTHDRLDILRSVAGSPTTEQLENELQLRAYIRQLRLVDVDDSDLLAAANDFLRSVVDRTAWAERGMIDEHSFDQFADELNTTWRHKKDKIGIAHADKAPVLQGRLLFRECMEHQAPLDGLHTPAHFTRGSWHALTDDQAIGWHSDYVALLAGQHDQPAD